MRITIVYDCLYPHTVGGAERWYRALAQRIAANHDVTYLTRRQWEESGPDAPFRVVAVSPGGPLYSRSGRRRIWPPLRFGWGVFWHLLRHGRQYDLVHMGSFPYFSLLGAGLALNIRRGGPLIVDWHEVWTREYWINYAGPVVGRIGHLVQRLCVLLPAHSFTFSRMHARRLAEEGHRAPITRLTGEYADDPSTGGSGGEVAGDGGPPLVVFAGRHIPEKQVTVVPDVIARARQALPSLRCVILGDGPDRNKVARRVDDLGLRSTIELPGWVSPEQVRSTIGRAACLLLPSVREGYGLVVVEAVARGTPTVVADAPENAATELVEPGVNGFVAPSADPEAMAERVVEAIESGEELRRSTRDWYERHARELSIESSLAAVEQAYAQRPSAADGS